MDAAGLHSWALIALLNDAAGVYNLKSSVQDKCENVSQRVGNTESSSNDQMESCDQTL